MNHRIAQTDSQQAQKCFRSTWRNGHSGSGKNNRNNDSNSSPEALCLDDSFSFHFHFLPSTRNSLHGSRNRVFPPWSILLPTGLISREYMHIADGFRLPISRHQLIIFGFRQNDFLAGRKLDSDFCLHHFLPSFCLRSHRSRINTGTNLIMA